MKELNVKIRKYNREIPVRKKSMFKQLEEIETKIINHYSNNENMTIEMYEQMNTLEAQRNKIQTQINNLQERRLSSRSLTKFINLWP